MANVYSNKIAFVTGNTAYTSSGVINEIAAINTGSVLASVAWGINSTPYSTDKIQVNHAQTDLGKAASIYLEVGSPLSGPIIQFKTLSGSAGVIVYESV